jgi:hypothetical protein
VLFHPRFTLVHGRWKKPRPWTMEKTLEKPCLKNGEKLQPALRAGAARSPLHKKRRAHRTTKIVPLTRDKIDGRSNAAKQFDAIASGIAQDLGGEDRLSTVQKHLVEAFAGAALHVNELNAKLLLGDKVDLISHSTAISTLVRVASRLGIQRLLGILLLQLQTMFPTSARKRRRWRNETDHRPSTRAR